MMNRGGRKHPTVGQGRRVVAEVNWRPCPGHCGADTVEGRWCHVCCCEPEKLVAHLRDAVDALKAHRAPEDRAIVAKLDSVITTALWRMAGCPADQEPSP